MPWVDALLFSAVWVALAAAALTAAVARVLGAPQQAALATMAFAGTLVVYLVDRLRDVERDRATSPRRTAFVTRHRGALAALAATAGAGALAVAAAVPHRALLAPLAAAPLALLHRRLKRFALAKAAYVTAAWVAVVVGLPAAAAHAPTGVGGPGGTRWVWAAATVALAIYANAVASNVRDREAGAARVGAGRALAVARGAAAASLGVAWLAPAPAAALGWIAAATLAALLPFRRGERYGLGVVDGALIAGAVVAWLAAG